MDKDNIKAIRDWPSPNTITVVHKFHGLPTFYMRFVKNFSDIMAPITDCMRKGQFKRTDEVKSSFKLIKEKLTITPVLSLPDFDKDFEHE